MLIEGKNVEDPYSDLEKEYTKLIHLSNILGLASWDASAMLAPSSAPSRHAELATLSSLIHDIGTSDKIRLLIDEAQKNTSSLNEWQTANLRLIKKNYQKSVLIPSDLKKRSSLAASTCEFKWREARKNNDFAFLAPYLDEVFECSREIAAIKADFLGKTPHEALIEDFDPGQNYEHTKKVFQILKSKLPDIIAKIQEKQENLKVIRLNQKIDIPTQKKICLSIMQKMGFPFDKGRLDESVHPFCSGSNDDIRITTRYSEDNFLESLFGVIHETGHALYQANLPQNYRNQLVGQPGGMALHESQSLIMEMQACISHDFMGFLSKILHDDFNIKGPQYSPENLYNLMTQVGPSLIRVDADEVTYPLHVILRFEIEQEILSGLKAAELPQLWNSKMQEYLKITPDNDSNGCMQDLHWPSGAIGYFPAYTHGAIIASMLMKNAKKTHDIKSDMQNGIFENLNDYLNENFRNYGSLKERGELLKIATGEDDVNPEIFLDYLKTKYL